MDTHHFTFRYLQQRKHYRIGHTPPYLCVFTAERDFRIARERGNIWGGGGGLVFSIVEETKNI